MLEIKFWLLVLIIVIVYIVSAIGHEADLSRNFKKSGDAKAWFFDIKAHNQSLDQTARSPKE